MVMNQTHVRTIFIINLVLDAMALVSLFVLGYLLIFANGELGKLLESIKGASGSGGYSEYDGLHMIFGGFAYVLGMLLFAAAIALFIGGCFAVIVSVVLLCAAKSLLKKETKKRRIFYRILMGPIVFSHILAIFAVFIQMIQHFSIWMPAYILALTAFTVYEILMIYTKIGMTEEEVSYGYSGSNGTESY